MDEENIKNQEFYYFILKGGLRNYKVRCKLNVRN